MINGKIGIVIVNYNGEKFQNDCIRTIKKQTYTNYEIIVVDSGSTDNSILVLKEEFEDVVILEQKENVGVVAGNNIGMKYAFEHECEFVLLMNNDVELRDDMVEQMVKRADANTVIVPKIYFYPGKVIWMCGGIMDWKKGEARHIGIGEEDKGQYDKEAFITYSPTCAMLIHRDVVNRIGYEDENYFMYFDDTDYCAQMVDNDIQILYVPKAVMWHKVSSSSGGVTSRTFSYYNFRNQFYFLKKYKLKCSVWTRLYAVSKIWMRYILSPIRNKNDKYIRTAYLDYKNKTMGRKDWDKNE